MNGAELRSRRVEKGVGQRKLSKLSGVSQREISKAENSTKVRDKLAARLVDALK